MIVEISTAQFAQLMQNKALMKQAMDATKGKHDDCSKTIFKLCDQYIDVAKVIEENIKEG